MTLYPYRATQLVPVEMNVFELPLAIVVDPAAPPLIVWLLVEAIVTVLPLEFTIRYSL